MEIILSIINWLFTGSIYGIVIIAAVVYFITLALRKTIPKVPNPYIIATVSFFIALFTMPSIPRYQFEKESLAQIEGKAWMRVVHKTKLGSIAEPLTWIKAPIGSLFIVMPNRSIEGGYREVLLRYKEKPVIRMADPDCIDKTILYSEPDAEGVFRYTSLKADPMNEDELSIYCKYDWSKEKEALRSEMLKQIKSQ